MIRASIRRQVTERATNGDIDTYLDEWQLETDAAYNPDACEDLASRVHALWSWCQDTVIADLAPDEEA